MWISAAVLFVVPMLIFPSTFNLFNIPTSEISLPLMLICGVELFPVPPEMMMPEPVALDIEST